MTKEAFIEANPHLKDCDPDLVDTFYQQYVESLQSAMETNDDCG